MPTLETAYSETRQLKLGLALILFDGFTGKSQLVGLYDDLNEERADEALAIDPQGVSRRGRRTTVRVAGRSIVPRRRESDATFLFLGLPPGTHTFQVRSPYYEPRDLALAMPRPDPRWPAFPDVTLADESLPLESPAQPAAYRAQRALVGLQPSVRYPFPGGATLVRGVVRSGGQALRDATVHRQGDPIASTTEASGGYVLFFTDIAANGQTVMLEAAHPLHATVTAPVTVVRGLTVLGDFALP
jgi:hypothetical protein